MLLLKTRLQDLQARCKGLDKQLIHFSSFLDSQTTNDCWKILFLAHLASNRRGFVEPAHFLTAGRRADVEAV